jgi:CRP/FNR family transcriptional regulator, cyclic AMP receptor protein
MSCGRRAPQPLVEDAGMADDRKLPFVLASMVPGLKRDLVFSRDQVVFAQGDPADSIYYLREGKVKVAVISKLGKEAVIAILDPGSFFGEGCLTGQNVRIASAMAMTDCTAIRLDKNAVIRMLYEDKKFSEQFTAYLLARNARMEADLADQLFNSSEKRLARILLILANFGKEGKPEPIIPSISQETLAEMVGTTRSRVSFFMNKFRQLGFIDYNGHIEVHSSLLNVVLLDDPSKKNDD